MLPIEIVSPAPMIVKRKITSIFVETESDLLRSEIGMPREICSICETMEMKNGTENTKMIAMPMSQHNRYRVAVSRKGLL